MSRQDDQSAGKAVYLDRSTYQGNCERPLLTPTDHGTDRAGKQKPSPTPAFEQNSESVTWTDTTATGSHRDPGTKELIVFSLPDKNSVCVFHKIKQDGTRKAIGTGFFFMEQDLVATARHVMEDHANAREPYALSIQPSQSLEGCLAVECAYHIEQDLALVKLERRYPVVPLSRPQQYCKTLPDP